MKFNSSLILLDSNPDTSSAGNGTPVAPIGIVVPVAPLPPVVQFKARVAGGIYNGTAAFDAAVAVEVTAENNRRTEAILKGVQHIRVLESEVKKASKPDVEQFGADGKPVLLFTKAGREALNKANEKLSKAEAALAKAVNESDFTKLYELVKGSNEKAPANSPTNGKPATDAAE